MNRADNLPVFNLITGNEGKPRPAESVIREFESAISESKFIRSLNKNSYYVSRLLFRTWNKFLITDSLQNLVTVILRLIFFRQGNYFIVLMGPRYPKCFPYVFSKGTKAIYMFDAWPSYYNYIIRFIKDFKIDYLFISSKQSATALNELIGKKNVFWVPEGVNPNEYKSCSTENRDIDVLAFGRKFGQYHEMIVGPLANQNINYLYSSGDQVIFKDQKSFIDGLSRTKISVCFPTNVTHAERSGNVETMTNRFLQSMASKCLVIGKAPEEMIQLFGYNPVVDVDMKNPAEQIIEILRNFEKHFGLIEKNYKTVVEKHTWEKRGELISTIISEKMNQNKEGQ